MVEVMVVLAIITVLFSLVMVNSIRNRKKAAIEATRALIQRIELALDDYKILRGHYPPDGFDSDVYNEDGEQIYGSASLYYHLTREIQVVKVVGGKRRLTTHEPVMEFRQADLSVVDEDYPGVREVVDGFSTPIHYDNTENEKFSPQDGSAHIPEVRHHPPDPRESEDYGVVDEIGIQKPGAFEIWSHGPYKHLPPDDDNYKETIAAWNMSR